MSLEKAIKSGKKEWRGRRRKGCGSNCAWCTENRQYATKKALMKAQYQEDEDNPYEGKWYPVIPDDENPILQAEYRMAKHLRKVLKLDDEEEVLQKTA